VQTTTSQSGHRAVVPIPSLTSRKRTLAGSRSTDVESPRGRRHDRTVPRVPQRAAPHFCARRVGLTVKAALPPRPRVRSLRTLVI
jgi:hypothetical protein